MRRGVTARAVLRIDRLLGAVCGGRREAEAGDQVEGPRHHVERDQRGYLGDLLIRVAKRAKVLDLSSDTSAGATRIC